MGSPYRTWRQQMPHKHLPENWSLLEEEERESYLSTMNAKAGWIQLIPSHTISPITTVKLSSQLHHYFQSTLWPSGVPIKICEFLSNLHVSCHIHLIHLYFVTLVCGKSNKYLLTHFSSSTNYCPPSHTQIILSTFSSNILQPCLPLTR
jgi:hypothetical protein